MDQVILRHLKRRTFWLSSFCDGRTFSARRLIGGRNGAPFGSVKYLPIDNVEIIEYVNER